MAALQDSEVQAFIAALKQSPHPEQQRRLTFQARQNVVLMHKLGVLVDAGVLAMQL